MREWICSRCYSTSSGEVADKCASCGDLVVPLDSPRGQQLRLAALPEARAAIPAAPTPRDRSGLIGLLAALLVVAGAGAWLVSAAKPTAPAESISAFALVRSADGLKLDLWIEVSDKDGNPTTSEGELLLVVEQDGRQYCAQRFRVARGLFERRKIGIGTLERKKLVWATSFLGDCTLATQLMGEASLTLTTVEKRVLHARASVAY